MCVGARGGGGGLLLGMSILGVYPEAMIMMPMFRNQMLFWIGKVQILRIKYNRILLVAMLK